MTTRSMRRHAALLSSLALLGGLPASRAQTPAACAPESYVAGMGHGPQSPPRVRVFGRGGAPRPVDFYAYGGAQRGVNATSGIVDATGCSSILTGPGPGVSYGPHVRGFRPNGNPIAAIGFFAYGTLAYGVNVATVDIEADGYEEIVTAPGPSSALAPQVRGFDYDGVRLTAIPTVNFYGTSTVGFGANVGGSDVDADGRGEILSAAGPSPSFAPHVCAFDYENSTIEEIEEIDFWAFNLYQYGTSAEGGDVNGDGFGEILATPGPGPSAGFVGRFRAFTYASGDLAAVTGYDVTAFATLYGGTVGASEPGTGGRQDLVAGPGPDPAAGTTIVTYTYTGGTPVPNVTFEAFPGNVCGARGTGGDL